MVLLDQEMDRAEAFRLAKHVRLPAEVVLSSDGALPKAFTFYRVLGLDAYPIVRRMMAMRLDVGMSETLGSVDVPYADRLSHLVDIDDPVRFVDLRGLSPESLSSTYHVYPTDAPDRSDSDGADGPRSAATQDLAAGAANAGDGAPIADAGGDGARRFQSGAEGVGFDEVAS